jgi:hypothetical protein
LTLDYESGGMIGGFLRLNNFGSWGDSGGQIAAPDNSEYVSYSGELIVDLEVRARFNDMFSLAVGGENRSFRRRTAGCQNRADITIRE